MEIPQQNEVWFGQHEQMNMSVGSYFRPRSKNFPALDSVYIQSKNIVWRFQTTVNEKHGTNKPRLVNIVNHFAKVLRDERIRLQGQQPMQLSPLQQELLQSQQQVLELKQRLNESQQQMKTLVELGKDEFQKFIKQQQQPKEELTDFEFRLCFVVPSDMFANFKY